jgi:hypothetical protein
MRNDEENVSQILLPVIMGTRGRYLEIKRAVFPLVESTKMALALCSVAAATEARATVSTVSVGRFWMFLSSSNIGGKQIADSARRQVSAIMRTI